MEVTPIVQVVNRVAFTILNNIRVRVRELYVIIHALHVMGVMLINVIHVRVHYYFIHH